MFPRVHLARLFRRWAGTIDHPSPRRGRWLRLAVRAEPVFSDAYRDLVTHLIAHEQFWEAVDVSRDATARFADTAQAWMLRGVALQRVYRYREALEAFEQALLLEDRADAAMASGRLLRHHDRHRDAAARFALAHACGGGLKAMQENAQSLHDAGDSAAAEAARRACQQMGSNEEATADRLNPGDSARP